MTKVRIVRGLRSDGYEIWPEELVVRVTVDAYGKSLSISNDRDTMFQVSLEGLEDLVRSGWEHHEGQNLS